MPIQTLRLPKDGPLHEKVRKKIDVRIKIAEIEHAKRHDKWREAEDRTLAFLPETELDLARRQRREAGTLSYTTIQVPYSYAVLMSAHTYWTSVFFARNPIHQYSGRHGEGEQQTQAMEALIDYQVQVGMMVAPYYIWLYDAGKYGCGILGTYWDKQKLHYGQLVEMPDPLTGEPKLFQTTQEVDGYTGNCVYNVSVWDFMHDPRVSLKDFQKGEFCCRRVRIGWNQILQRRAGGYYNSNVDSLQNNVTVDRASNIASQQLARPQFDRYLWDESEDVGHPAGTIAWEFYVDLIPKEWGIGGTEYPQKWVFTITEDRGTIIGASPLGLMHCKYPFDVMQSEVEGYGSFTRGVPEIVAPIQNTVDWLLNTHFYNVRSSLNNQFIVDPSKLVVKDIKSSGPGFVWRLRPEAYGTDITKMFMQVPVTDVTQHHMVDFQAMYNIGERTVGINEQMQGGTSAGGRKTATEVRTSTGFGVNRQKTITEYMSASAFAPHSQKLVQSSQQNYDAQAKLRRVGDLALEAGQRFINVAPADIVGFFDFVPVDGILPVDRMAQANLWKEVMAGIRYMPPQVAQQYDWGRIFAWVAQLGGLKNINQFKIQVLPDEQLQQQAAQGNVIPLGAPSQGGRRLAPPPPGMVSPGNSASTAAGLNAYGSEGG